MPKDQALFRVEFFIQADKLGKVLWLLAGDALNLTQQPVINARPKKGGGLVPRVRSGELVELFRQFLIQKKLTEVNSDIARTFCKQHGRAEGSYSLLLSGAAERGYLKNIGNGLHSKWKVLSKVSVPGRALRKRKVKRKAARKPVLKVVGGANG